MPKCANCAGFYPPELCEVMDEGDHRCLFCKLEKDEIEVNRPGEPSYKYTKKQAQKDYKRMLKELAEKPNIAKILAGGKKENDVGR